MRRTLALLTASLALTASAAQARPGSLDRSFSEDGRLASSASGAVVGLTLTDGLAPLLTVIPGGDGGRPTWMTLTATGRIADRIALPASMQTLQAVWSGTAIGYLAPGEVALVRQGRAATTTLKLPDATIGPASLAIDRAGRVLIGGSSLRQPSRGVMMRFLPTGVLDTTYAVAPPPSIGRVAFILPNADGSAYVSDGQRIARLDSTGQPQAGFEQGQRLTPARDTNSRARALVPGPDGMLLAVGRSSQIGPWIARLRADGRLDPRFGRTGHVSGGMALRRVSPASITHDRRGRLLVAGNRWRDGGRYDAVVLRLSADGRIDRSFGTRGRTLFKLGFVPGVRFDDSNPAQVVVDRRGRIVVAGTVYDGDTPPTPYPAIARLEG